MKQIGFKPAEIFKDIGTSLNLFGTPIDYDKFKVKSDSEALKEDWNEVGNILSEYIK